jgi:hypothetical protein
MSDQCHSDVKSSLPQRVRLGVCNMGSLVTDRRPETTPGKDAILEQLERLLAHPAFKSSKRCLTLLRYVVEHNLSGEGEPPKERTLGMAVFGRPAEYDTNADPIVRATAGEVRKRIAQYYHEPERDGELRIDLRPGSYTPQFHMPSRSADFDVVVVAPAPVPPAATRRPIRLWLWPAFSRASQSPVQASPSGRGRRLTIFGGPSCSPSARSS